MRRLVPGLLLALCTLSGLAQMVSGLKMKALDTTLGLDLTNTRDPYTAQFLRGTAPGNILWPGEQASFTFQLVNTTKTPLQTAGKVECIAYGTKGIPGNIWLPLVYKIGDCGASPIQVDLAPGAYANITVTPQTPETLGAYALVVDLGKAGRRFVTTYVRTFKPTDGAVQYPQFCMDVQDPVVLTRLGTAPNRIGVGYKPTTDKDFEDWYVKATAQLREYQAAKLPVTVEIGGGAFYHPNQPLGRPRPWLDADNRMLETKFDLAWLPSYDADFRVFVKRLVSEFGWPKGPVNGIKLWNEPWNGISISGWGADDLRYREIFLALCEATDQARKEAGVEVLIGGCDSSSNTFDKLFCDGKDDFLQYLDFCSIHYQGMNPPSTVKAWVDRKHPLGRVRVWDTESWVANVDDRVATVIATNLSTGHDRAVGIYGGNISTEWHMRTVTAIGDDGKPQRLQVSHTWSVAAAVGAASHFIGERKFSELLFKNGLPWVMVFRGRPSVDAVEDGTVVIAGDIGEAFGADGLPFRTARGFAERKHKLALQQQLAALPADADPKEREALETALATPEALSGATMTLKAQGSRFSLYDCYGNPVPATRGSIVVPLDHRGYYLRADGKPGSFAALLEAIRTARVMGIEPLAPVVRDLTARIDARPALRLTFTNVLNRPVAGTLKVAVGGLTLDTPSQKLAFTAHETKDVVLTVTGGKAAADNTYPLTLTFDAGKDGTLTHAEAIHANVIAHRTITVDGKLDDWTDVPPQTVNTSGKQQATLEEKAWLPFMKYDESMKKGFANGFLAYDDTHFYFAAKIADSTPDPGTVRFATRDDDAYFYPATCSWTNSAAAMQKKDVTIPADAAEKYGLLKPGTTTHSATAWVHTQRSYAFDLTLPEDKLTQVALYILDWDPAAPRTANVEIYDLAADRRLTLNVFKQFTGGQYLLFELAGKVRVKITGASFTSTAPLCGIFFDPSTSGKVIRPDKRQNKYLPYAAFLKADADTHGAWPGVYGKDGYLVIGSDPKLPDYARLDVLDTMPVEQYTWPEGVRRFSYRARPMLPAGNAPNFDNVQIAFNVLPAADKPWYPCPPGTMPGYIGYADTDYEYALNTVAPPYGGGTEIWRLRVPGMPHKHFYPRSPASPFDGPVKDGTLVTLRDGNTRLVECAIPWRELPHVKQALDAGRTIKFSFRVNDNAGVGCLELARGRSASKRNSYAFYVDWVEHWANEIAFGVEK
jgi:hypothetical protein